MSVITELKIAQHEFCVALYGALKTPSLTLAANTGVTGVTLGLGAYGAYRLIKAKSATEALKFGALSAIGFAVAAREIHRNFTDYTNLAHTLCSSPSGGNRFPGWEQCSKLALGAFRHLEDKLSFTGYFSCPIDPR